MSQYWARKTPRSRILRLHRFQLRFRLRDGFI